MERIQKAMQKRTFLPLSDSPSIAEEVNYISISPQEAGSMEPNIPEAYRYFNPQRVGRRAYEPIGDWASVCSIVSGPDRTVSAQMSDIELVTGDTPGIQQSRTRLSKGFGVPPISPQLKRESRTYSGPLGIFRFNAQVMDLARIPAKTFVNFQRVLRGQRLRR